MHWLEAEIRARQCQWVERIDLDEWHCLLGWSRESTEEIADEIWRETTIEFQLDQFDLDLDEPFEVE